MAVSIGELEATLRLRDQLSSQLRVALRNVEKAGASIKKVGDDMKTAGSNMTVGITAPLVAAGGAAFKFGKDFESAMVKVNTLSGVSADRIAGMREEVLGLSKDTGRGPQELANALLVVTSTGLRGAEAMEILTSSAQAAATGLGEAKDIARSMTSAITAYGKENLNASEAANKLFVAVREGGAEANEFAGTLGRVVGIASQVGVSFDEVLASVATFTRLGVDADEAVTALRGTLSVMLHPTKQASEQMVALGSSMQALRDAVRRDGLAQALQDLVKLANGNEEAIGQIIPNVRALAGVLGTAGAQGAAYTEIMGMIKNANTEMVDAFGVAQETLALKWDKLLAKLQVLAVELGDKLAPNFDKLIDISSRMIDKVVMLVEWFGKLPTGVQDAAFTLAVVSAAAGPVIFTFGGLLSAIGSLVAIGPSVATFFGGLKVGAAASTVLAGALKLLTGPLGWVVGIAAVVLTATGTWGDFFRILKYGGEILMAFLVPAFQRVVEFGGGVLTFFGKMVGFIGDITALNFILGGLGKAFSWAMGRMADELERFALTMQSLDGEIAIAEGGLTSFRQRVTDRALPSAAMSIDAALASMAKSGPAAGKGLGLAAGGAGQLSEEIQELMKSFGSNATKDLADLQKAWAELPPDIKKTDGAIAALMDAYGNLRDFLKPNQRPHELERMWENTPDAIEKVEKAFEDAEKQIMDFREAGLDAVQAIARGMEGQATAFRIPTFGPLVSHLTAAANVIIGLPPKMQGIVRSTDDWRDSLELVIDVLGGIQNRFSQIMVVSAKAIKEIDKIWQGNGSTSDKAAGTIVAGLSAAASATGNSFLQGAASGAALGTVIPGIGNLAGALIGGGVGALSALFGGDKEHMQVNDMRDSFVKAAGGLHELNVKAQKAGMSLTELLRAKTVEDYERAVGRLNQAFEAHAKKVERVKGIITGLGPQFGQIVGGFNKDLTFAAENMENLKKAQDDLNEATKRGDSAGMKKASEEIAKLTATQKAQAGQMKGVLGDLGVIATASFGAAIEAGYTFAEAIEMNHEGLTNLRDAYENLGLDVEDPFLKFMLTQDAMLTNNPQLIQGVSALGQSLSGLGEIGLLNTDTFAAMQRTGMEMFTRLQAEAAKAGGSQRDALLPMQEFLRQAEKAAKDLGVPLDDNTQMLIDQSKELGIWKDIGKTSAERIEEGIERLIKKMETFIDRIGDAGDAMADMPAPRWPETPSGAQAGIGLAGGTHGQFVNWGSGTNVRLHGYEAIVPRGSEGDLLGAAAGGGMQVIENNVYLDGELVYRNVEERQAYALRGRVRMRAS